MKLTHYERKKSNELNDELINQLFQIMDEYYLNTDKNEFFKDLQQKDTILILYDINNIPVGFTTWVTKQFSFSGIQGKYVYSGDTVIKKEASGSLLLPIAWGKSMLSILDSLGENEKLYWLLTTKGFRTYRYLSVFYKEFYPSPIKEIKSLKLSCEYISKELFSNLFNSNRGILDRGENKQSIKNVKGDLEYINRSPDKFVQYFYKKNPKFYEGQELVCITEFHRDNLHPFILKAIDT